jgi:hypothetical protein
LDALQIDLRKAETLRLRGSQTINDLADGQGTILKSIKNFSNFLVSHDATLNYPPFGHVHGDGPAWTSIVKERAKANILDTDSIHR